MSNHVWSITAVKHEMNQKLGVRIKVGPKPIDNPNQLQELPSLVDVVMAPHEAYQLAQIIAGVAVEANEQAIKEKPRIIQPGR